MLKELHRTVFTVWINYTFIHIKITELFGGEHWIIFLFSLVVWLIIGVYSVKTGNVASDSGLFCVSLNMKMCYSRCLQRRYQRWSKPMSITYSDWYLKVLNFSSSHKHSNIKKE